MYLPRGYIVYHLLEEYIREKEVKLGYYHVMTPCLGNVELYRTSGHLAHYQDGMFPIMERE
jgi:threonyl-tRNA synthetase